MFGKELAERFAEGLERSGRGQDAQSFLGAISRIPFHDVDAVKTFTIEQLDGVFMGTPMAGLAGEFQLRWSEFATQEDYDVIQREKALHFL